MPFILPDDSQPAPERCRFFLYKRTDKDDIFKNCRSSGAPRQLPNAHRKERQTHSYCYCYCDEHKPH